MKGYAQSQTVTAAIDSTYVGKAVDGNSEITDDDINGSVSKAIVPAAYIVPFLAVSILLIFVLVAMCCYYYGYQSPDNTLLDKPVKAIIKSKRLQANIIAALLLCTLTTVTIFCVDVVSLYKEAHNPNLPTYYPTMGYGLFWITLSLGIISMVCLICGIVFFIIVMAQNSLDENWTRWLFFIAMQLCAGSTVLSLSFHFQNILMAWSNDPFYASKIAIFYGIFIFIYFIAFKYAYSVSLKLWKVKMKQASYDLSLLCFVIITLTTTFVAVTGIIATAIIFVVYIPVNNSIEESADGVRTIYNGAILFIGGIIVYNVGWFYFRTSFSLEHALKKAMRGIKNTPFNPDNSWETLSEEGRMTEVMKALIYRETIAGPRNIPVTLTSAVVFVIKMARKSGQPIVLTTDQSTTLTTFLTTDLNTAVTNAVDAAAAAVDPAVNKDALNNALINALYRSTSLLNDPNIDLTILPTDGKRDTLRTSVQKTLTAALNANQSAPALTDAKLLELKQALEAALKPEPVP